MLPAIARVSVAEGNNILLSYSPHPPILTNFEVSLSLSYSPAHLNHRRIIVLSITILTHLTISGCDRPTLPPGRARSLDLCKTQRETSGAGVADWPARALSHPLAGVAGAKSCAAAPLISSAASKL